MKQKECKVDLAENYKERANYKNIASLKKFLIVSTLISAHSAALSVTLP